MKRILTLILSIALALSLTACSSAPAPGSTSPGASGGNDNGDILIGASVMLTGTTPLDGERMKQAIELVIKETNEKGGVLGGRKLKLIVEDDQGDQTMALNVANKLLSSGVSVIIGPHSSTNSMAVQELIGGKKVPFVSGGTSPALAEVGNKYMFTGRASDSIMASVVARYAAQELGAKKVGIMYNNNEYGTGGQTTAEAYFKEAGVEFVSEGHNSGDKDMTAQLMKAKQAGCDTIFIWAHAPETVILARQIQELGLDMNVVACPTPTLGQVADLCETEWLEGWYAITDYVPSSTAPHIVAFKEKFNKEYGVDPEMFAAAYYGATQAVVDSIERAGSSDPEAIRDAMASVKGIQGIVGDLTADEKNAWVHEGIMVVIKNKIPEAIH